MLRLSKLVPDHVEHRGVFRAHSTYLCLGGLHSAPQLARSMPLNRPETLGEAADISLVGHILSAGLMLATVVSQQDTSGAPEATSFDPYHTHRVCFLL